MEDHTAAAAANTNGPPPVTTVPSQRGQKRGRGAEDEDGDEAAGGGAARGSSRRVRAGDPMGIETTWWFATEEEFQAAAPWSSLADLLDVVLNGGGGAKMGEGMGAVPISVDSGVAELNGWDLPLLFPPRYDFEFAAAAADSSHGPASPEEDVIADGFSATAGGHTSAEVAGGRAPDTYLSGPLGFDLNELLSSNVSDDEGFPVVPENAVVIDGSAAATADGGGSVELAANGATARASARGFDFDLNQPCPTEFPDGEPDPSDVLDLDPAPVPAEGSLAAPEADEPPELPDGGAPVPPTRRRRSRTTRLWDWAFQWTLAWP